MLAVAFASLPNFTWCRCIFFCPQNLSSTAISTEFLPYVCPASGCKTRALKLEFSNDALALNVFTNSCSAIKPSKLGF